VSVLRVYLHDRYAGLLERPDEQLLDLTFTYDRDYLAAAADAAVPLSLSLPLRTDPYTGATARNWFAKSPKRVERLGAARTACHPEEQRAVQGAAGTSDRAHERHPHRLQ